MILKIRTGWDVEGHELFKTISGVQSVEDHGLCDPYDISTEPCWYQLCDDRITPRAWIESTPPRVLKVAFSDRDLVYALVDAYLCNDTGATLGRYCGNWRVIDDAFTPGDKSEATEDGGTVKGLTPRP